MINAQMFKRLAVFLALLGLLALIGGCGSSEDKAPAGEKEAAETVEPIVLKYANFFPPTHIQSQLAEQWCREVESRTGGAVKIDYFPGGTLTKGPQVYDGVVEGISDIGLSVLAYSRGRFPVMAAVDLPLGYKSGVAATAVANSVFEQFQPQELADTKVMYFHAHGPGLPHTKGAAVRTMEDLQGLKLRATGNSAKVVEALGGTPVPSPMGEAYAAIQKGVVDGGMYPIETNKGWKLGELVDYCTEAYSVAYTTTFFVVMNMDKWNSLPVEAQAAIEEINAEWAVKHGQAWDASDVAGKEFFLAEGNEFVALAEGEDARWAEAVAPILDAYVADVTAKGLDGAAILQFIRTTLGNAQ